MRTAEILAVGGVVAGAAWWIRREHRRERQAERTAARLAELAAAGAAGRPPLPEAPPRSPIAAPPSAPVRPAPPPRVPAPAAPGSPASVTSPPVVVSSATQTPSVASPTLTRAFDPIFQAEGRGIPVAYLRALAHAESGLNPASRLGLINVVAVALEDYNRRHPQARLTASAMRDPRTNVRVAVDVLRTIIASYRQHHPDVRNLAEDWSNAHFVGLLTAGWNAGFSERGGVGRVVKFLRSRPVAKPGDDELTVEAVFASAAEAGATRHLSNPAKLEFARRVTRTYLAELARDRSSAPSAA